MKNSQFPIFIDSTGKEIIVIGGGTIGTRRVNTLSQFNFSITVVSENITDEIRQLVEQDRVKYIQDTYDKKYIGNQFMVLACTDNREVNHEIGEIAKERKALVSVADNKEECNFFFPAVAINEQLTMGLVGSGNSHSVTKQAAAKLKEIIKNKKY